MLDVHNLVHGKTILLWVYVEAAAAAARARVAAEMTDTHLLQDRALMVTAG
jgi:hypothetical protein